MDERTSLSLLEKVKSGEKTAWERLTAIYGPLIYQWSRKQGLGDADSRDVMQDVFQVVARRISAFRRDREGDSFRGWLHVLTRYRIADFRKRAASQPPAIGGTTIQRQLNELPDEFDGDESWGSDDGAGEVSLIMRGAVELVRHEFEEKTFRIFWRVAVEGESPTSVATEMQMGVWAVYQAKSRVMRRLRSELEGLFP